MIRPITFVCLVAAFGSGLYLYSEKHRAILLDRDIAHAIHGTEAARERTGLLRAEWALLNDPGRLQDMADKYLALKPMAPGQFVQLADLSTRLPPPAPPPAAGTTDDGADDPGATPASTVPQADTAADAPLPAPASPAVEPEAPALVAKAEPARPAPSHAAAKKDIARAVPKKPAHPAALASRETLSRDASRDIQHDGPLTRGTMLPLAGIPQAGARVMSAMARPMRPMSRPAVVSAYPAAISAAPYVGSALGHGTSLPPPVPLP